MKWFNRFKRKGASSDAVDLHGRGTIVDPETGEIRPADAAGPNPEPAQSPPAARPHVRGERAIPSVNRERSLQSHVRNSLAGTVIALILVGGLVWYYAAQYARHAEGRATADKAHKDRVAGDSQVPPLGPIDPPSIQAVAAPASQPAGMDRLLGPPPPAPTSPHNQTSGTGQPAPKTPEQLALERRLGQPVLLRGGHQPSAGPSTMNPPPNSVGMSPALTALLSAGVGAPRQENGPLEPSAGTASLGASLRPTPTPAVTAQVLPGRRLLMPKGTFIDCTLETAIDSTLEGMVTCIGANDVYGADGKVVLLDRGTKYVGERRGEVRQGQARVFVLWTEARTPGGVVVNLASPGTDALGRAGLEGAVDTHFWDRFGAAILVSVIDGVLQAAASGGGSGSGTNVVLNPQGTHDVMTDVLKGTLGVPPTIVKNQGDRIQVLVARDVDFRSVYSLRADDREP
jgi:type IV secretion system protein VirB10